MRIYFDVCALGRLLDTQDQARLVAEADAVNSILRLIRLGSHTWITSDVVSQEIGKNSDSMRRALTLRVVAQAQETHWVCPEILVRAATLQQRGLAQFDAQHLAVAEAAQVDALLTTDDRFIKFCSRMRSTLDQGANHSVDVLNPVDWLQRAVS